MDSNQKVKTTISINKKYHDILKKYSNIREIPVNEIVNKALAFYLNDMMFKALEVYRKNEDDFNWKDLFVLSYQYGIERTSSVRVVNAGEIFRYRNGVKSKKVKKLK